MKTRLVVYGLLGWVSLCLTAMVTPALCSEPVSFKGQTVTILVGSKPGGTSDLSARLFTPFLSKYLPGQPTTIVQNMPGAHNMTAMNYFTQQVKPNGLTVIVGSGSEVNPLNYRVPQSRYDPTTFAMVGAINLGGSEMIIRNEALPRLKKGSGSPVALGSIAGYPHIGAQIAAWGIRYLGWNAKWVTGYGNNGDLAIALEKGEIDLTSLADESFLQNPRLLDKKEFTLIYQTGTESGTVPSKIPALAHVPLFSKAMEGKITDPVAKEAYEYWRNLSYLFKWIALPPETPQPIVAAYRSAFRKMVADPDFATQSKNITPGFSAMPVKELEETVRSVAKVRHEALGYMTTMLREQGLDVQLAKKKSKHKKK